MSKYIFQYYLWKICQRTCSLESVPLNETALWICVNRHKWSTSYEGTLWHHKEEGSDKPDQDLQKVKLNDKPHLQKTNYVYYKCYNVWKHVL